MRLNVTLVSRRCSKLSLNNDIGLGKTGFNITHFHFDTGCNIGSLRWLLVVASGEHIVMQDRRIFLHGIFDVHHRR